MLIILTISCQTGFKDCKYKNIITYLNSLKIIYFTVGLLQSSHIAHKCVHKCANTQKKNRLYNIKYQVRELIPPFSFKTILTSRKSCASHRRRRPWKIAFDLIWTNCFYKVENNNNEIPKVFYTSYYNTLPYSFLLTISLYFI